MKSLICPHTHTRIRGLCFASEGLLWIAYDSVEFAPLVPLRSSLGVLGLACAELTEVFGRLGRYVGEEFHFDPPEGLS